MHIGLRKISKPKRSNYNEALYDRCSQVWIVVCCANYLSTPMPWVTLKPFSGQELQA